MERGVVFSVRYRGFFYIYEKKGDAMLKIDKNKKYLTISMYAAAILAITIAIVLIGVNFPTVRSIFNKISTIVSPIIIGLVISYICNPIMSFYEKKLFNFKTEKHVSAKLKRILSIALAYISLLAVIALIISLTIPKIIENYEILIQQITDFIVKTLEKLESLFESFNVEDIEKKFYEYADSLTEYIGTQIADWGARALTVIAKIFIGCVLSFYILLKKEKVIASSKKYASAFIPRKALFFICRVLNVANNTFGKYFIGSIFDSVLLGIATFIICWILKIPYYSVVSVIVCITNVIPYFGPFLGAIPSFMIIFIFSPMKAIWFAVIILVLQQIDGNIVAPRILGNAVGLSALWVIIAVTVMGGLFGLLGMVLGIPLFSTIYVLIKDLINARLEKKNMPTELSAYSDVFSFTDAVRAVPQHSKNEDEEDYK